MTRPLPDRTREAVARLAASTGPVLVGPWLSEVGFEILYWVPFLRWICREANLPAERVVAVSRGGPQSWYQGIAGQYIDVLQLFTPEDFRAQNAARVAAQCLQAPALGLRHSRPSPKQHLISAFDHNIIGHVECGIGPVTLLHPSLMYAHFRAYWRRKARHLYRQTTVVQRLQAGAPLPGLPASYVAMKFYASSAFPDTPTHRSLVQSLIRAQAARGDVVLLHAGTSVDDHSDFPCEAHPRVHRVALPPAQNLDIQTRVIAGARAFHGTYGGFAYLAPFLGVPTRAFFAHENFRRDHRDLMLQVARQDLTVPFSIEPIARLQRRAYAA